MTALHQETLTGLRDRIARGDVSAVEVTRHFLDRIAKHDAGIGSFLFVDAEGALAAAAQVDAAKHRGEKLGKLAGVPIAIKDNLCTRGVPTTCASKMLQGYVPPYDAHVIERLRQEGAVLVGKTNMDEFAMGSSNENSAYGPVKNPWERTRAPGGSSGGSAASVAAGFAAGALGSDTGGSVRQPGSFCGVTAFKPTYGRISRYGLIAFASSLDQVGPITRTVRDGAALMSVLAGHDGRDATSVVKEVPDYEAECGKDIRGLRIGVARDTMREGLEPAVARAMESTIETLRKLGCEIVDISLPHAPHAVSVYYLLATAEASSNLARFDGMRYALRVRGEDLESTYGKTRGTGFGPEVQRRIMLGTYALSAGYYDAFYIKAQKVRTLIVQDYVAAFEKCDAVLTPTSPSVAFKLGERVNDPLSMYLADIFTLPPSLAGLPAVNIPCGFSDENLPIGFQLTGRLFDEPTLVRIGDAFERSHDFVSRHAME